MFILDRLEQNSPAANMPTKKQVNYLATGKSYCLFDPLNSGPSCCSSCCSSSFPIALLDAPSGWLAIPWRRRSCRLSQSCRINDEIAEPRCSAPVWPDESIDAYAG